MPTEVTAWKDSAGNLHSSKFSAMTADAARALGLLKNVDHDDVDLIIDNGEAIYRILRELHAPQADR